MVSNALNYILLLVIVPHPFHHARHFLPQPKRFQHFKCVAVPKEFLLEVEGGAHLDGENAVFSRMHQLLLRGMQRQGTQVVGLVGAHFQFHGLDGAFLVANDTETAFKVVLWVEFLGVFEGLLR